MRCCLPSCMGVSSGWRHSALWSLKLICTIYSGGKEAPPRNCRASYEFCDTQKIGVLSVEGRVRQMVPLLKQGTILVKKCFRALHIMILMVFIRLGLRWLTLPKLLHLLQSSNFSASEDLLELQQVAYYADRLLKLFPYNAKGNCLPRSLILYVYAPRYGYRVKFHCGVRKSETGLDGHAWLTSNGQPFLESTRQIEGMVETFSYPHD